jgi:tRNA (cytosine38-C5)-methyltransferase
MVAAIALPSLLLLHISLSTKTTTQLLSHSMRKMSDSSCGPRSIKIRDKSSPLVLGVVPSGIDDNNNDGNNTRNCASRVLTFVEFYCGVGGWTMALEKALTNIMTTMEENDGNTITMGLQCLAALDNSELCTKVYKYNHHQEGCNPTTTSIERLTLKAVERWNADVWAMSPPCQPHTRQHDNQQGDLEDPRSKSFLHLCHLIETMESTKLPKLILVENVIGFEQSNSCLRMRQVLRTREYSVGHFHLSPTQCGLPNDRPRYYCVATRQQSSLKLPEVDNRLRRYLPTAQLADSTTHEHYDIATCPISSHLQELGLLPIPSEDFNGSMLDGNGSPQQTPLPCISSFLDQGEHDSTYNYLDLKIPPTILNAKSAWCFDIVTPQSQRSSCFTHGYGKFVRGTGSVLYTGGCASEKFQLVQPELRVFDKDWAKGLDLETSLRYFSGSEMARLLDFKDDFGFPKDVTLKQQWKLLGNSLNVRVASRMCELGLRVIL